MFRDFLLCLFFALSAVQRGQHYGPRYVPMLHTSHMLRMLHTLHALHTLHTLRMLHILHTLHMICCAR